MRCLFVCWLLLLATSCEADSTVTVTVPDESNVDIVVTPKVPVPEPTPDPEPAPDPGPSKSIYFTDPEIEKYLPKHIFPSDWTCYQSVANKPVLSDSSERIRNAFYSPNINFRVDWGSVYQIHDGSALKPITIGASPNGHPQESFPLDWKNSEKYQGPFALPDDLIVGGDKYYFDMPATGPWVFKGVPTGQRLREAQEGADGYGGDRHAAVYDPASKLLYEYYKPHRYRDKWYAGYAVRWDCSQIPESQRDPNYALPYGQTSADAAGLPITPLILRYAEYNEKRINHAIRFTLPRPCVEHYGKVWPASHSVGTWNGTKKLIRMGERLRLKSSYQVNASAPDRIKHLVEAMKSYGIIMNDIGGTWQGLNGDLDLSQTPSGYEINTWLWALELTDFEVVDAR